MNNLVNHLNTYPEAFQNRFERFKETMYNGRLLTLGINGGDVTSIVVVHDMRRMTAEHWALEQDVLEDYCKEHASQPNGVICLAAIYDAAAVFAANSTGVQVHALSRLIVSGELIITRLNLGSSPRQAK